MLIHAMEKLKVSIPTITPSRRVAKAHQEAPMARKKRPLRCKFCGNVGHIVKACKDAEEYVLSGRCMRDASGKILLPSGAKIPRETPGKTLRDRCDVYH